MPPPRPRLIGCNTGIVPARPNPNTPMSERQQMALLIQMTASSDNCRSTQKPKEYKKDEDFEESHNNAEKIDVNDKSDEAVTETKKDACFDALLADQTNNSIKRNLSDIDEDELDDIDDTKKKKRKESETAKDFKQTSALRIPNRVDKTLKQTSTSKTAVSATNNKNISLCDKDETKGKSHETDIDDDDSKSDPLCSGGLKVPPLKIVIPQQSCTIDTDGNGTRTGKINTSRNAALPYVVSSNSDSTERDMSIPNTSPRDSPVKTNHTCGIVDEKSCKLLNEEKNLRVLRSAHRIGLTAHDRHSNNSSPQIPSNSPSPASSTTNDLIDSKIAFSNVNNSPPHQNTSFEHDNILNLPSPSTSSTSSSKDTIGNNVELHPRKRKIKSKNDDVKSVPAHNSNNDTILCSDSHPHDIPFTNCFQMYMTIRKQIEKKWKNVVSVKPRPPQGFNEFLINTKKYLLHPKQNKRYPVVPYSMSSKMREVFLIQQKERFDLYQRHIVEKEKLCINVEQEIIRIHSKAARSMSCQSLALSVCTYIKEEEVYNMLTPEQDDKDKNARYRFNGRLLLSWLQDVDDKWEKIKESMVLRHHNEAESLHAVQLMDWETALKKNELCDLNSQLIVEHDHVPIVHVSDDFDLLPA